MVFETGYFPQSVFYEHLYDIALQSKEGISACVGMQTHYGLTGVHTYNVSIAHQSYMISGVCFGYDMYRENQLTGSAGFDVLHGLTGSVSIALLNYWVKDHYSRYGYTLHMSAYYTYGNVLVGGWLHNINTPHLHDSDAVPLVYTMRVQYSVQDNLKMILATRGTHEWLPFFNAGISWTVYKHIIVGVGANTNPLYCEYMLQVPIGRIGIHYTGTLHEYLGLSHAMRITFDL